MKKHQGYRILKNILSILLVLVIAFMPSSLFMEKAAVLTDEMQQAEQDGKIEVSQAVKPEDGVLCDVVSYVYTTERKLSVTFNGMADKATMEAILDELDKYNMKALFLLPGIRVAEEPDIADEIIERGHLIGNATLNQVDLTGIDNYSGIYDEIVKANEVIERETGVVPRYLYNRSGSYNDDILAAAAACGLDLVTYSINLQSWKGKNAQAIKDYLLEKITRGAVIALGTEDLTEITESIRLIAEASEEMGYAVVPLEELQAGAYERKPLEEIAGYDAAKINTDYEDAEYKLIYSGSRSGKMVCLTFDDWGSDMSVNRILDILKQYNIKATFFLRANGVEDNPNLAKAIAEDGHDVGNHTYSHPVITDITPLAVEEEVVKCHQILTEAIQKQPLMVFRPPTGEIDEESAKAVAAAGYEYISLYDLSPHDWDTINKKDDIINYVKEYMKAGSVTVLHLQVELDTYKALPALIEYIQEEGYEIVPLSKMIESEDAVIMNELSVSNVPSTN